MPPRKPAVPLPPREDRANKRSATQSRKDKATCAPVLPPTNTRPRRAGAEKAYYADRAPIAVERRMPVINPSVPRLEGQEGKSIIYIDV